MDEVMRKVPEKKGFYHVFFESKTSDNWRSNRKAKRAAKKAVAAATRLL